jgi:thymidylate synthase
MLAIASLIATQSGIARNQFFKKIEKVHVYKKQGFQLKHMKHGNHVCRVWQI